MSRVLEELLHAPKLAGFREYSQWYVEPEIGAILLRVQIDPSPE